MDAWIVWALVGLGLVYGITESAIFAPIRLLLARVHLVVQVFVYCAACTGFWVGLGLGLGGYWPVDRVAWYGAIESAIALMCLGALWGRKGSPAYAVEQQYDSQTTRQERAEEE